MLIAPSLLAADFGNLQSTVKFLNTSEADYLHIDLMDGVFVPNITFGFPAIKAVRAVSTKPLDIHLMTVDPVKLIPQIRDCGATVMTIHVEACTHIHRALQLIRQAGMKAGVALNPGTPLSSVEEIATEADLIMLMAVNPGFGGQSFITSTISKTERLKKLLNQTGSRAIIGVDGGVNAHTGRLLAMAGADMLIAGSYVFNAPDPLSALHTLKTLYSSRTK